MRAVGRRALLVALQGVIVVALLLGGATPAYAAKPGGHGGGGQTPSSVTGNDISYPQCGSSFPAAPAFGMVGLTGGTR